MAWDGVPDLGGGIIPREKVACFSCNMRSYGVGGLNRCVDWRRLKTIVRCSKYKGPKSDVFLFVIGKEDQKKGG
jgi:hypothetical protein